MIRVDKDDNIVRFNCLGLGMTLEMDIENASKYMRISNPDDIRAFIEQGGRAKVTQYDNKK